MVTSSVFYIPSAFAAGGDLDPSFGGDGIVTTRTDIEHTYQFVRSVALQSDGKIVVAGYSEIFGNGYDFAIVRYNSDGTLDTNFGTGGIVTTDLGGSDLALSMVLQGDEKIVVAGYSNFSGNYDFAVVQYNSDGTLDTNFGTGGIVATDFGNSNSFDYAISIALQSDGKIVAAGNTDISGSNDYAVVRYNADGTPDTSFSGDGKVTTDFGTSNDIASSMALQSNGKIVVAGYSNFPIIMIMQLYAITPMARSIHPLVEMEK